MGCPVTLWVLRGVAADDLRCMLLCSEEVAYQLTDHPVRLYIAGGSHTLRAGDRRPMQIPLLPNETEDTYRWLYDEMAKQDGRWPGFESFCAARFAAYMVYRMAGVTVPIDDLDLVETHDAFTISDLQTYGDVGLTLYGREQDYVTSGECLYLHVRRTRRDRPRDSVPVLPDRRQDRGRRHDPEELSGRPGSRQDRRPGPRPLQDGRRGDSHVPRSVLGTRAVTDCRSRPSPARSTFPVRPGSKGVSTSSSSR